MINMRRFFQLFVFTLAMTLVETPHCRADDSYYDLLKKAQNPSASEKEALRRKAHEKRRRQMNEISRANHEDLLKPAPDLGPDDENEDDHSSQNQPEPSRRRPEPIYHSDSPAVKVNPGDTHELIFPGDDAETPSPKKN